jgi:hypothetical protein
MNASKTAATQNIVRQQIAKRLKRRLASFSPLYVLIERSIDAAQNNNNVGINIICDKKFAPVINSPLIPYSFTNEAVENPDEKPFKITTPAEPITPGRTNEHKKTIKKLLKYPHNEPLNIVI